MSWTPVRAGLQVFSMGLLMAGIVLTVYSVVTVRWQELDITEFKVFHAHGLWKDCWVSTAEPSFGPTGRKVANPWKCTFKFNQEEDPFAQHSGHSHGPAQARGLDDGQEIQHLNLKWHKVVFGLLIAGAVIGLVALLFSFCAFCKKPTAILWAALTFVAAACDAAGLIIFFRCSHDKDYRFVHFHGKIYEQSVGQSFWLGLAGTMCLLLATIFAVLTAVVLFLASRRDSLPHPHKTWPKHHTAV